MPCDRRGLNQNAALLTCHRGRLWAILIGRELLGYHQSECVGWLALELAVGGKRFLLYVGLDCLFRMLLSDEISEYLFLVSVLVGDEENVALLWSLQSQRSVKTRGL